FDVSLLTCTHFLPKSNPPKRIVILYSILHKFVKSCLVFFVKIHNSFSFQTKLDFTNFNGYNFVKYQNINKGEMSMPKGNNGTSISKFGYKQELKRSLSFKDLLIYGLIFMVPIAPFGIYGE